jgi:hypothetical protein
LAHQALVGLPVEFIQKEVTHVFTARVRDQELKQHLLMGNERSLNESLNQALKMKAEKQQPKLQRG